MEFFNRIKLIGCFLLLFSISCISAIDTPNNSEEKNIEKVIRALSKMPCDLNNPAIHKISGGLTNANYKVTIGNTTYFMRLSCGQNDILQSSLEREWLCTSSISSANIAPKPLLYVPGEGVIISEFIERQQGDVDLNDKETLQRFITIVKKLHQLDVKFPSQFCPFESIQLYTDNAIAAGADIPSDLAQTVLPWVKQLKQTLVLSPIKVPCHLDLHHGNLLNDGENLWILDWEYAAMGDPLFDIAVTSAAENFSDEQMQYLLEIYLDRTPSQEEFQYLYKMRILADARWASWCFLQAKISPLNAPFFEFGEGFLEQCLNRIFFLTASMSPLAVKS